MTCVAPKAFRTSRISTQPSHPPDEGVASGRLRPAAPRRAKPGSWRPVEVADGRNRGVETRFSRAHVPSRLALGARSGHAAFCLTAIIDGGRRTIQAANATRARPGLCLSSKPPGGPSLEERRRPDAEPDDAAHHGGHRAGVQPAQGLGSARPRCAPRRARAAHPRPRPGRHDHVDGALMDKLPKLEIVANFGVGYDTIDASRGRPARHHRHQHARRADRGGRRPRARPPASRPCASCRRSIATCAPASGSRGPIPLTATLRGRKIGILGLGRIGKAIAQAARGLRARDRLSRPQPADGRALSLLSDASSTWREDVDVLICVAPGGDETKQHRRCRGPAGARARRHPDQCRPRHRRRRARADRGAAEQGRS